MNTKFKVKFLNQYLAEIFGNQEITDPLLTKNLSQKTKFNIKKLGVKLQEEQKMAMDQVKELYNTYTQEVPGVDGKPPTRKIVEETRKEFEDAVREIEEMVVDIEHSDFEEKDFLDRSTGEVVAGNTYYNLIDILLKWEDPL